MNGVLASFQDPELAFIPAGRVRRFSRGAIEYIWVASLGSHPGWKGPVVLPYRALNYARESFLLPRKSPSQPIPSRPRRNLLALGEGAERDFDAANQGWLTRHIGWRKNGLLCNDRSCFRDKIAQGKDLLACKTNKFFVVKSRLERLELNNLNTKKSVGEQ